MNYVHHDLGHRQRGEIVEITLSGNAANVRLMDISNFNAYKGGRKHRYTGGLAKKSPVRLAIPSTGRWHVAVDMQGLRGQVRSSARILPNPLPELRQPSLASVPSLVLHDYSGENGDIVYDVFISHASEDKDEVVRPLANELRKEGLRVWYDEFELNIGDSIRRKIDHGISHSRFGIVVLSRSFLKKGWTGYELDGIVTRTVSGEQIILPVWHEITKQEVMDYSPSLADRLARNTAISTIEEIASEIVDLVRGTGG